MRGKKTLVLVVAALFVLLLACLLAFSAWYLIGPRRVAGPLVTIRSPHNAEQVGVGEVVNVHSTSRDEVNKVARVELWVDGKLIDADTHPQGASLFTVVQGWQPLSPGSHTIIVRAFNGAEVPGQATIGVKAVEVPPGAVVAREPLPLPGELPPVEEFIEGGSIPPGSEVDAPPGGLPAEEEAPAEEEGPVVLERPAPEAFYTPPDPDEGPPPEDIGDLFARIPREAIARFAPRPEAAPIWVEFEALEFAVDESYDDIYCYLSLADEPVERVPESEFLRPIDERRWNIAEHLGGENGRVIEVPSLGTLRVFVECYGWSGATWQYLGLTDVLHPPEDWDGHTIRVHGTGSGGFDLDYRIFPLPSIIPAPYNLVYATLGNRSWLGWRWDGNEAEIHGFRVYRNDNLVASPGPDFRSLEVSTWTSEYCGEINEFYVKAYRGDFGEGIESSPRNLVAFAGPPCAPGDDILSVEELPTYACGNIREVDVHYRYGSDHGDQVWIGAWPVGEGGTPFGGCSKDIIGHGEGVSRMYLEYQGEGRVDSSQLLAEMWDLAENVFYSEIVNFPIVWHDDRPDLFISDAEIECDGLRRVVIENGGCGRAETDELHLSFSSSDGEYSEGSIPISISLGPGEKYEWRYRIGVPPGREEEFKEEYRSQWGGGFWVEVDPDNLIAETNEENNSFEAITAGFAFLDGGRRIKSCIPIFGEPDTDEDGINDKWENAATIELNPYIELDEEEDLKEHPEHHVVNFVRVAPYPSKDDPRYILFYNVFSWSRDYGRFGDYVTQEAHAGDTEPFMMAWEVVDNYTIKLCSAFNFAHGGKTKQENIWPPSGVRCNTAGIVNEAGVRAGTSRYCSALEFYDSGEGRPRLLLYASEDKHALYPSCGACESIQVVDIATAEGILDMWTLGLWRIPGAIQELFDDDHLGTQSLVLTYDDLTQYVGRGVIFEGSDYRYELSVGIDNSNLPNVRIFLKSLYCDNQTNGDEGNWSMWSSDEPYLIMAGFLQSPTEVRAWAPDNQPRGSDVDSGEDDGAFENVPVFEGEVTPETTVGFVFSLFEDDYYHNDPDASERREKANEAARQLYQSLVGETAPGECGESHRVLRIQVGEDCGSPDPPVQFPAYNVGEPDHLWITDTVDYGFPVERVEGVDCAAHGESGTGFCGSFECHWKWNSNESKYDFICARPILDWMRTQETYESKKNDDKWKSEHPNIVEFFEGLE